jgi:hypothetical protein
MLQRAPFSLVPALLALAFLFGLPGTAANQPAAAQSNLGVTSWNTYTAVSLAARGNAAQENPDGFTVKRADQDDNTDDRSARPSNTVAWPSNALHTAILCSHPVVGPDDRPCNARPRAPPAV